MPTATRFGVNYTAFPEFSLRLRPLHRMVEGSQATRIGKATSSATRTMSQRMKKSRGQRDARRIADDLGYEIIPGAQGPMLSRVKAITCIYKGRPLERSGAKAL
jgi:hypothetical protein